MTTTQIDGERKLRADARRNHERILEGARVVFARCGFEAQMDDVARQSGVGVGTVYRHFPTKEALVAELVRAKFHTFAENARAALEQEGEPFEVFADTLRRNAEVCGRDAAMQHALIGFGEPVWTLVQDELQDLNVPMAELMERAQLAGTMRADVSVRDIPMLMSGVAATMAHAGPGFDWHRHLELVIGMLRA